MASVYTHYKRVSHFKRIEKKVALRERERDRDRKREREIDMKLCIKSLILCVFKLSL